MTVWSALTRTQATLVTALIAAAAGSAPIAAADEPAGQKLFLENKCNMCHSVDALEIERTSTSDKMKAADLSTIGDDLDLEWAVKFIKKEVELEGSLHKKEFKGSDADAQAIAEWLITLKTGE